MEEKSLKITQKIFYQNIEILELKRIIFTGSMSTIPTLLKILTYLPPQSLTLAVGTAPAFPCT